MNKRKSILAISVIAMAAIVSVAVVSCKKEDTRAMSTSNKNEAFDPRQIEDMSTYLKDFKLKMQNGKGSDALSIEDAAWHLSGLANYDFANANVVYEDVRFDTIFEYVNVTGKEILMQDLNTVYEKICTDIDKLQNSLYLYNQHFRFFDIKISDNGLVTISSITTFSTNNRYWGDTTWYFPDSWYADSVCYSVFNLNVPHNSMELARTELKRVLNLFESHPTDPNNRVYYIVTNTQSFYYRDHIDPYGSPSYLDSRLFAGYGISNYDIVNDLCYYYDSYLDLGYKNCPTDKTIVSWDVSGINEAPFPEYQERYYKGYHLLTVQYGYLHEEPITPGDDPIF